MRPNGPDAAEKGGLVVDNVLILAGGSGTRLWPASTKAMPKQFLRLAGGKSLLQLTVERAFALQPSGDVMIITIRDQLEAVARDCEPLEIPHERLVLVPEPTARNTAPAVTVAMSWVRARGGSDATALVLPADHLISPVERFRADAENAEALARDGRLVTFGIPPSRPETGYGYIEAGSAMGNGFEVRSFKEKPDEATAERFLKEGNFYWNSGMFAFTAGAYWAELAAHAPEVHTAFDPLRPGDASRKLSGFPVALEGDDVAAVYETSPTISIDYAIMEKSSTVAMVPTSFDWNDVGSWDEIAALQESGGTDAGSPYLAERADGNFVYSDIPVALCGVEDLIVVVKNGMLLVCRKGESQGVKQIVTELKDDGRDDLL